MDERGNKFVRYADDVIVLCKSKRAAERQIENAKTILEGRMKVKLNMDKSRVVSVYSVKNFKFLGFAMGKNKNGAFIRIHPKSLSKAKQKIRQLTSRNQGKSFDAIVRKESQYIRGWMGYYALADIKGKMREWDGWRRRRYRMIIWKQWKNCKGRIKALKQLGIPHAQALKTAFSRKSYWRLAKSPTVNTAISNERLESRGFLSMEKCFEDVRSRWRNRRMPSGTSGGVILNSG